MIISSLSVETLSEERVGEKRKEGRTVYKKGI